MKRRSGCLDIPLHYKRASEHLEAASCFVHIDFGTCTGFTALGAFQRGPSLLVNTFLVALMLPRARATFLVYTKSNVSPHADHACISIYPKY